MGCAGRIVRAEGCQHMSIDVISRAVFEPASAQDWWLKEKPFRFTAR